MRCSCGAARKNKVDTAVALGERDMDSRKIAILTWYRDINYGTALQACALFRVVKELGCDPAVIQYRPRRGFTERPENELVYWFRKAVRKIPEYWNKPRISEETQELFQAFLREKVKETAPANSGPELKDLNGQFDGFVCGSDQIWSLNGFDENYFLPFVEDFRKKIAYAPSLGRETFLSREQEENVAHLINSFRHLSVRETQSAELIQKVTGQAAKVVLDPTLLLDSRQWDQYIGKTSPDLPEKQYILCHFYGNSRRYMGYVRKLAAHLKLPYYCVSATAGKGERGHAVPFAVGPREYVSLIRNAAFVCTDSFHGMVFAANYNVPFCVFERFQKGEPYNQNMRITSFLRQLRLEERLVDPTKSTGFERIACCEYRAVNETLRTLREDSLRYLAEALDAAVKASGKQEPAVRFPVTEQCCGCGACAAVCPTGAVSIIRDEAGFLQCEVEESACIRCRKCLSVCPMAHISARPIARAKGLYEAQSCQADVRRSSSSGGMGHELARYANQQGYTVCGCAYNPESNSAEHILIGPGNEEKLPLLQGSKYIQSSTEAVMQDLWHGKVSGPLAFFGTPCQVAAVDKLLREQGRRDHALLVDLICLGVPSAHLWERHIQQTDRKWGLGPHPAAWFRYKDGRRRERLLRMEGNGRVYLERERKDDFYAFFRRKLCHMGACYDCPYRERSGADLRLGDYWGERFEEDREMHSMVISNTCIGASVLEELRSQKRCAMREYPLREYWLVQHPYNSKTPDQRRQILEKLGDSDESLHTLRKQYCGFYDRIERVGRCKSAVKKLLGVGSGIMRFFFLK